MSQNSNVDSGDLKRQRTKQYVYTVSASMWHDDMKRPTSNEWVIGVFSTKLKAYHAGIRAVLKESDDQFWHDNRRCERFVACTECKAQGRCRKECPKCAKCDFCEFEFFSEELMAMESLVQLEEKYADWEHMTEVAFGEAQFTDHTLAPVISIKRTIVDPESDDDDDSEEESEDESEESEEEEE